MPKPTQIKVNIKGDIITLYKRKNNWYADFRKVDGGELNIVYVKTCPPD